jgi:hypothetical protein
MRSTITIILSPTSDDKIIMLKNTKKILILHHRWAKIKLLPQFIHHDTLSQ